MKSRHIFVMVGGLAIGLSSPMAMGADKTNCYFNTNTPCSQAMEGSAIVESSVLIQGTNSSPLLIEKTLSAPALIERINSAPVVIEDRIVKQKHKFGLGIWPLFDFEIL
jgi:hypothetical protein